jgi:hypothetical protein
MSHIIQDLTYSAPQRQMTKSPSSPRRRSRDLSQELQRRQEFNRLIRDQLDVVVVPADTRLYLWNGTSMSKDHFITTGDLNLLVKRNHGPMASFIAQLSTPDTKSSNNSLSNLWSEVKNAFRDLPVVRDIVKDDKNDDIYNYLMRHFDEDAIFMAYSSSDGKVAVKFFNEGANPDITSLR